MTHYSYDEIVLDSRSLPWGFYNEAERRQMQGVVDSYYTKSLNQPSTEELLFDLERLNAS